MTTWIIIGVAVVVALFLISMYNGIIALRNRRDQSFADIDVQLKLRVDLVPNLVETVKGYATHERETLTNVTAARTQYMSAQSVDDKIAANNMLTGALKSIFALSESYPDLKANASFLQLQSELADIENKIAAARRFFNASTQEYNTYIESFPNNIVAGIFHFTHGASFEVVDRASVENAPAVKF